MQVELYNKDGNNIGQIELNDKVFGIEPREHVMHQAIVAHLANKRQGTAKTKNRSEVSGGGKKPWRQKGRGTARAGSTRSPLWVGGGTIHGPKPHKYTIKLTKKVRQLARHSAFSLRLAENNIKVVDDFSFDEYKTKNMIQVFKNLELENEKTLVLLSEPNQKLYYSTRNIPKVSIQLIDKISTYDILNHKKILLFKGAVEYLNSTINN
jgi:large subunit ribosomal protein L4